MSPINTNDSNDDPEAESSPSQLYEEAKNDEYIMSSRLLLDMGILTYTLDHGSHECIALRPFTMIWFPTYLDLSSPLWKIPALLPASRLAILALTPPTQSVQRNEIDKYGEKKDLLGTTAVRIGSVIAYQVRKQFQAFNKSTDLT